jgi:hypothetical protein
MNYRKNHFIQLLLAAFLVGFLLVFLFDSNLETRKIGAPVIIQESGFKWVMQGIVTGDIRIVGGTALVRVRNPRNTEYFEMTVLYTPGIVPVKEICEKWKIGQPIIFYRDGVAYSNQNGSRSADIGIFAALGNWEDVRKNPMFKDLTLDNPQRK